MNTISLPTTGDAQKLAQQEYIESISVAPEVRTDYATNYQRLDLPSEQLGMDKILKENYLLQYAMQNPITYVERRNHLLKQVKIDTDKKYVEEFKKYTTGDYKLPPHQAKELANKSAYVSMVGGLEQIEALYPSKFENRAFNSVLRKQQADDFLNFQNDE
eukprot:gene12734-6926_t